MLTCDKGYVIFPTSTFGKLEVEGHIVKELRINESIRTKEVRLIGDSGEQVGIMPLYQALQMARERNLDLVEVASTAVPPVCRILDYGKFKYERAKKEKESRHSQRSALVREIRLRPRIKNHDLEAKARQARKFLDGGDKVKVSMVFRGREITHPELGRSIMQTMLLSVKDDAMVEKAPSMEGNTITVVLTPSPKKKAKEPVQVKEQVAAKES